MLRVRFADHPLFVRRTLYIVLSALVVSAAFLLLGAAWWPLSVCACAIASVWLWPRLAVTSRKRMVAVATFWTGVAMTFALGGWVAPFGLASTLLGIGLAAAVCQTRWRMIVFAISATGMALVAEWVFAAVYCAPELAGCSSIGVGALAAAMAGLTFALALVPLHMHLTLELIGRRLSRLSRASDEVIASLAARGLALWRHDASQMVDADRSLVSEGLHELADTLGLCDVSYESSIRDNQSNIVEMEMMLADCQEEAAARHFAGALEALREKQTHLERLDNKRRTTIAAAHKQVATLERLACANYRANA